MIYIRTIKNLYGIDVIIDSTTDQKFVETTGLEWISLSEEMNTLPKNGSYFYEGKIIPIDSEDYGNIISPIINKIEDPFRIERENEEKKMQEELELQLEQLEMLRLESPPEDDEFIPPVPPDPNDLETINELTSNGLIDPRDLPPPQLSEMLDVESTEENFEEWKEKYYNISALLNALTSNSYKEVVERVVIFDPPFVFPDGVEQSNFPFPENTVEEYIDYLIKVKEIHVKILDKICLDLDIPKIT